MKRRGNYGNVDSNAGYVPDTPTQMLCHLQRFLEQKQKSMYESTCTSMERFHSVSGTVRDL